MQWVSRSGGCRQLSFWINWWISAFQMTVSDKVSGNWDGDVWGGVAVESGAGGRAGRVGPPARLQTLADAGFVVGDNGRSPVK